MWWQGLHPESTPDQAWGLSHWEPDAGLRLSDNPSHTNAEEAVMVCVWCVWCGMCGVCVCARVSQAHRELPCLAWVQPTQPPWNVGGCSGQAQTSPSVCTVPLLQGTGPCTHRTLHAHFNGPEPVRSHRLPRRRLAIRDEPFVSLRGPVPPSPRAGVHGVPWPTSEDQYPLSSTGFSDPSPHFLFEEQRGPLGSQLSAQQV